MSSMETRITAPNGAVYAVVWRKDRPQHNPFAAHDVYQITAADGYRQIGPRTATFRRVMDQYLAEARTPQDDGHAWAELPLG